jgi:ubiquinone/menaquinone biosynthesis C-methylase UbiE
MTGFDARAAVYDALRPQDDAWWSRFDAIVRLGNLRGRRVLDIGCGTGALAESLSERAAARVWGVDPSEEMVRVARARVPRSVGIRTGRAEELPFRESWFDGAVFSLVVHLVARPSAFTEAARVLVPGGRVVVATFAHDHFDTYWAARFFPSIGEIDRRRFPTEEALTGELTEAGFDAVESERISSRATISRQHALERIRGRHISTFDLLDAAELDEGTARAERELPAVVAVRLEQLVVAATAGQALGTNETTVVPTSPGVSRK